MNDAILKSVQLNLDFTKVQAQVQELAISRIRDIIWSEVQAKTKDLFYDPKHPLRTGHFPRQMGQQQDPDLGYMRQLVDAALTEVALDPKWHDCAKKAYDENFEKFVKEAAERKARHDANKLVFANRGERCKAEKQG